MMLDPPLNFFFFSAFVISTVPVGAPSYIPAIYKYTPVSWPCFQRVESSSLTRRRRKRRE